MLFVLSSIFVANTKIIFRLQFFNLNQTCKIVLKKTVKLETVLELVFLHLSFFTFLRFLSMNWLKKCKETNKYVKMLLIFGGDRDKLKLVALNNLGQNIKIFSEK